MKRIFFLLFCLGVLNCFAQSTDPPVPDSLKVWKMGGLATLNLSQASLTNWAQGGENSLSITSLLHLFANYKKGNSSWDNTFDATYGFLQSGTAPMRKSDDKIEFTSKYGYKTSKNWNIASLVNFKSQFTHGYNYPNDSTIISDFLAPAYILVSTGMDYKPNDHFSFFTSPATGKITIVNNQTLANAGAYGVEKAVYDTAGTMIAKGKKVRYEFGALISIGYNQEIVKNINVSTKATFFSNYFKNPQNIDVNWDVLISFKVNKFVSASINTTLIYDDDIPIPIYHNINGVRTQTGAGPRVQFKEVLGIGFSHKF
ncbi:MAG: DUF3078 domain-containing protein [Bacteroidia bacterium]